jgi:hypothetical protein
VLGPLAGQQGEACARAISEWRESSSVWQCRASVVAFANLASKVDRAFPGFTEMVLDNRTPLLGSQERFVQTDGGWVLRELSNSDEERVIEVEPFAQQPGWVRLATEEEAERLARFLGVELEFIWSNP